MTTFRSNWLLPTILLLVAAGFVTLWAIHQSEAENRLQFALSSASICGFPNHLVKAGNSRSYEVALGGQVLDCAIERKSEQLDCLERKLLKVGITFRGPTVQGNCTYVPGVP